MKYSKLLAIVITFFIHQSSSAQKIYTYYLDGFFSSVSQKNAIFIGKGQRMDSVFRVDCYDKKDPGFLTGSAGFKDSTLSIFHGPFQFFYTDGKKQQSGIYFNGKKQGVWELWNALGYKTDSSLYIQDSVLLNARYTYAADSGNFTFLSAFQLTDRIKKVIHQKDIAENGIVLSEVKYWGDTAITQKNTEGIITSDTLYFKKEEFPEFPGGNIAWVKFLEKSLGGFNPEEYGAGKGKYQVIVRFIVDEQGNVSNIAAETSWGFGMEEMVESLMRKSPRWIPAKRAGKNIKTFRRQPVTFIVESF